MKRLLLLTAALPLLVTACLSLSGGRSASVKSHLSIGSITAADGSALPWMWTEGKKRAYDVTYVMGTDTAALGVSLLANDEAYTGAVSWTAALGGADGKEISLIAPESKAEGSCTIALPSGLATGTYTLKVKAEADGSAASKDFTVLKLGHSGAAALTHSIKIQNGASLTIAPAGSLKITFSSDEYYFEGFNVYDGSFTLGGNAEISGGGVSVRAEDGSPAEFTMTGGTISGNTADMGGGVFVRSEDGSRTVFTMTGGTISGNLALGDLANGGGVYVDGLGTISSSAVFTMNGGTISKNTADMGGGVAIKGDAEFIMNGGTISRNRASEKGGGVYAVFFGTFAQRRGAAVTGNTAPVGANIYRK